MTFPSQSHQLLIGEETAGTSGVGTAAFTQGGWASGTAGTATPNDVGLIVSDVTDNLSREIIETSGISRIQVQKVTSGITTSGISFEGDIQHGRLFKFIVGPGTTETTSDDTSHSFSISQNPSAVSIESADNLSNDAVLKHVGQFVESAELGIVLNENLKLKVVFTGKTANNSGTASPAIISTLPVFPHALCAVKINGIKATEVQNATITVTKTIERSGGIGSNIYQQGHATALKFEFSANLGFTDTTFHKLFMGGQVVNADGDPAVFDFEISSDNGVDIGSGKRAIIFILKDCIKSTLDKSVSVGGLTFIDISGSGILKTLRTVDNITSL